MPVTNDELEIRTWATRYNAHPVERAPFSPDGEVAELAFVFGDPEQAREHLNPISWERFFAVFHLMGLVLRYDGNRDYELLKTEAEPAGIPFDRRLPEAS